MINLAYKSDETREKLERQGLPTDKHDAFHVLVCFLAKEYIESDKKYMEAPQDQKPKRHNSMFLYQMGQAFFSLGSDTKQGMDYMSAAYYCVRDIWEYHPSELDTAWVGIGNWLN